MLFKIKRKIFEILDAIMSTTLLPLKVQNSEGNGKQELEAVWVKHTEQRL